VPGSSRTVGRVVLDIADPFSTDVARGVEDVVEATGLFEPVFGVRESSRVRRDTAADGEEPR
jgi:DNA-binding LacI/PurR family transcriptional regulator